MSLRPLVILQGYDPSGPTLRTFYLTSGTAFITTPSETPASQSFDAALSQPLDVRRRVQSIRGGAVLPSIGDLRIHNQDGAYDAWLGYAFDGRSLVVRVGPESGAYPSAYPVVFSGTIDRLDVQGDEIVIRVRDAVAALNKPLADTLYAGDNLAPDGLEGGVELEGRVKPLAFGVVKNVPLVPVNTSKLIYQVSDSECLPLSVFDNGVALGIGFKLSSVYSSGSAHSGATYGGGLFVVAGYGCITTSPDGASWTAQTVSGATTSYRWAVTYGNGLYLAGGDGPYLESSPDGVTWTVRTSGFTVPIYGLAYGNGVYVAVGESGEASSSPDGVTWTTRTSGFGADTIRAVCYSEDLGLFCAVGGVGKIATSPNGTTWTLRTAVTTSLLRGVHYADDQFIAVGNAGAMISSPDGIAWTLRTSGTAQDLYAINHADGQWFAGSGFTASPRVSEDGINWTARGSFISAYGIASGEGRFVIGSNSAIKATDLPQVYTSAVEIEDDTTAPGAGGFGYWSDASGTYVRLGSAPFGTITANVTQGATAADRTAGQLFTDVLVRAGYSSGDWVAADITALDTADNSEVGLFLDDETTVAEALDALATTVGAWWGVDADGDFRIAQLTAPSGSSTFSITANDIRGRLERIASSDPLLGIPSYRTSLRYALADTLTMDGTVVDTDAAVQTTHLLAEATVEDSLYTTAVDAQAEATRRQTLRGTARSAYRVTVSLEDYASVDLGDVGTLTHPRFGLSGGALVRVLGVEPDARNRSVTLTLWK